MKNVLISVVIFTLTTTLFGQNNKSESLYVFGFENKFATFDTISGNLFLLLSDTVFKKDVVITITTQNDKLSIFTATAKTISLDNNSVAFKIDYPAMIHLNNINRFINDDETLVLKIRDDLNNRRIILFNSNVFISFIKRYSDNKSIYLLKK